VTAAVQTNVLLDFSELGALLREQLGRLDEPLDAFLLAAGMSQVLEDHIHRDVMHLTKVSDRLRALGFRRSAAAVTAGRDGAVRLRVVRPGERSLRRRARLHADLLDVLAERVLRGGDAPEPRPVELGPLPRSLRRTVQRLPNCFAGFDQRPEDCRELAHRLAAARPDRGARIVVLGLRTSGSYLAPLLAASLRAEGYTDVRTLTARPGARLHGSERRALLGRLVVVVDDPPRTGSVLARTVGALEAIGVPRAEVVLAVPLLGTLPDALAGYEAVVLPWESWAVHEQIGDEAARRTLSALLSVPVTSLRRRELVRPERGHARVHFEVNVGGARREIVAEGVGLGYFGGPAAAAARALPDDIPRVHGIEGGLLWREWLPEEWRKEPSPDEVVAYALRRRAALPVRDDRSLRLAGRSPAWELAAATLDSCFGKLAPLVRVATRRATRRLLATPAPSIVDGDMAPTNWFAGPDRAGRLLKVAFAGERVYAASGFSAPCFDALADAAAAESSSSGLNGGLREAWAASTGEAVVPERWLLHGLAYQRGAAERARERGDAAGMLEAERALARVQQHYAGELTRVGMRTVTGDICALDVDGVLETRWLGFPAIGPDGALALRTLAAHAFSTVLATGRSLDEVRDRCHAYGLAGGVAEYGGAVYDHAAGVVVEQLSGDELEELDELRRRLAALPGVVVDPTYRRSVRAYRFRPDGAHTGLARDELDAFLRGTRLRSLEGDAQTDFQVARVDKGTGLRTLADMLGRPVVLAVGDAEPDVPMLELAERAFAPAGSSPQVRPVARETARPYQAGLLEAVGALVGHRPGGCPACAVPARAADARLIATCLRAKDGGRLHKLAAAVQLNLPLRH